MTIPLVLGISPGVSVGANSGSPVVPDYQSPFPFTGTVKKALVDVSGEMIDDQSGRKCECTLRGSDGDWTSPPAQDGDYFRRP